MLVFGPALSDPGGMAAVERGELAVLSESGLLVRHIPTYTSRSNAATVRLFISAMAVALLGRHRETVGHVHASQRGSIVRGLMIAIVLRLRGVPIICTIHGSGFRPFAQRNPGLTRMFLLQFDGATVLGDATRDAVRALHTELDVRVLANAVEVPPLNDVPPSARQDLLFAGEVGTRKGVDVLIEAWAQLSEGEKGASKLILAGPLGNLDPSSFGDGVWIGTLPAAEVSRLILASRAGVLPSRAEAMPMFLLEVMARGRPVITTAIEDLPTIVGNGGSIVPPGDVPALADALRRALQDDDWVDAAGAAARRRITAHHSLAAVGSSLLELFNDVLRNRGGRE